MKFSAEVSEALAAARLRGPEAANFDNTVCIKVFQHLLLNLPWTLKMALHFSPCSASSGDILKTCCWCRARMHTLFSGKGKYYCQLTDCHLLAQLNHTSPERNFLSTSLRKTVHHDDVWSESCVCQNKILCVIYTQMCIIRNTASGPQGFGEVLHLFWFVCLFSSHNWIPLCVLGQPATSNRGYEAEASTGAEWRAQWISVQERRHWSGERSVDKTKRHCSFSLLFHLWTHKQRDFKESIGITYMDTWPEAQQQRHEPCAITITWHASEHKVSRGHQDCTLFQTQNDLIHVSHVVNT